MVEHCKNPSRRLVHLDLLRLLAIYFVVFNHTGDRGYMLFADRMDSPLFFLYLLTSVLCKVAVPLFFMISGALLLSKQEPIGKLLSKRILRMAVVLVLVSIPYYVWLHKDQGLGIFDFLTYIYGNSASTSLWYLYSYIALLLMMPFLRSMVKGMKRADFRYLIAGYLVMVGVIPCVEHCLWGGDKTMHLSFTPALFLTQNLFYALAGYYVEHRVDLRNCNRTLMWLGGLLNVIGLAVTLVLTHRLLLSGEKDPAQLEQFFNCFICIPAICLYMLVKHFGSRVKSLRMQKVISTLGAAVFGVYLIEKFSRALTGIVYELLAPLIGSFAASLIWCLAVVLLSLLIVVPAKHIPGLRKVVNRFI